MDLELVLVQGVSNPRSTSWSCRFLCRERDGQDNGEQPVDEAAPSTPIGQRIVDM